MKIRKGDTVVVISGKDKGKTGTVLNVLPLKNRLVVGGVNMRTRHMKKTAQQAGQKIQYEASIHTSNVMIIDPKTKQRSRIASQTDAKGKKSRIAVASGTILTKTAVTAKAAPKKAEKAVEKADEKKKTTASKTTVKNSKKANVTKVASGSKKESDSTTKKPFWKKMMNFGGDAIDDADVKEPSHMNEDHSVPETSKQESTRTHQRHD